MKTIFKLLATCLILCLASCYDDTALWESIRDHEARIAKLETLCNQMNTNISSLQAILESVQKNDYVTNVTPTYENGKEVGYTISFKSGNSVIVYHGKDGKNGENGTDGIDGTDGVDGIDGTSPIIGIKQDTDGIYYWTLDGNWLLDDAGNKIPTTGKDGKDGEDGKDGVDGTNGENGLNGQDAITPEFKIEDEYWYISYDNGVTWEKLGRAVSDELALFKDVNYENNVLTFTFADGNELSFNVGNPFRIIIGDFDPNWGNNLEIPYSIEGATGDVSIFVITDNIYDDAEVLVKEVVEETENSGIIKVRLEWGKEEYNGKLAIFAVDETGETASRFINLSSGVLYSEETEYSVGCDDSSLAITVMTNRTIEVKTNADWITYIETRAVEEKKLVFHVQKNEGFKRKAVIEVISGNRKLVIPITQESSVKKTFIVDITYNQITGGNNEIDLQTIQNAYGETLNQALGYESWQELEEAIGNYETASKFAGNVIVTAYDISTGESYGKLQYNNDYAISYNIDADGRITSDYYDSKVYFYIHTHENGIMPFINVHPINILAGETCEFGIMFSSDETEALIEIHFEMTEYEDPELGQYENPVAPGTYKFDITDEIELRHAENMSDFWEMFAKQVEMNTEVWEKIKKALGMTTYEIYKNQHAITRYYITPDLKVIYSPTLQFNADGDWAEYFQDNDYAVSVDWSIGATPESSGVVLFIPFVFSSELGNQTWGPDAWEAAENEVVITYQYIVQYYNDYEFVFNHEIKFKKAEE